MPSSERGWDLVWDKLLPQTKLPLSLLLKSLLVLFGLTWWGMISNLGKRRWGRGGEGAHKRSSMYCPGHISQCLWILQRRLIDLVKIKLKAPLAQRTAKGEHLQRSSESLRWTTKPVRVVLTGKLSSHFRILLKPIEYSKRRFHI